LSEQQKQAIEVNDIENLSRYIREKELVINQLQVVMKDERWPDLENHRELIERISLLENSNSRDLIATKSALGQQIQTTNQRKKVLDSYKSCL
jgi:hypothetical protein